MNSTTETLKYFTSSTFLLSLLTIIIMFVLLSFIKKYLIKKVAYTTKDEQHKNTFMGVIFGILQYIVVIVAIVIVLKINGVNVTSIVAGLGIIATLVGLALQDTMKDVISGINIYNNNFYKVGDLVMYQGGLCEVKYFSARVTKFQSFVTKDTFTVCNSTINAIEKVKDTTVIQITFDYEDEKKKIDEAFLEAGEYIKDEKYLKNFVYYSLVDIKDNGLIYMANIIAPGHKVWPIKVKFLQRLYENLKKAKVSPSFSDEYKVVQKKNI